MTALARFPNTSKARLPAVYEAAKSQLAECSRIDECKDWADKAAAIASYAKQAKDKSLERFALRIKARAIRRAGELLTEFEAAKNQHDAAAKRARTGGGTSTRTEAATAAGMSKRQKDTAIQVANVGDADFDSALGSDNPTTVTELAKLGTKSKPKPLVDLGDIDPCDHRIATDVIGHVSDLAKIATSIDPVAAIRGVREHERGPLLSDVYLAIKWLRRLASQLEDNNG